MGSDATATHFYDYLGQSDPAADNRKNFVVHSGYLYYIFNSGSSYGIRRIELSTERVETVVDEGISTAYSWDFVIDPFGTNLYAFVCQRPSGASNYLRVYKMNLDGSGLVTVYSKEYPESLRFEPAMVSDLVVRENATVPGRLDFYFTLTFSRNEVRVGFADLSHLSVQGVTGMLYDPLKRYENSLFAARSLVVHQEGSEKNIYFLEGTYLSAISSSGVQYPTAKEAGHLGRIDQHGQLVDLGSVWESFRDPGGSGIGIHTAFCSNLHRSEQDNALHLISGYGLLSDSAQKTQQSQNDAITKSVDNWVWLQYGKELATKIAIFPTNDRTAWDLLEELARVCDFEVGFTSGQEEIDTFKQTHPGFSGEPKGYLFFRPRRVEASNLSIDEGDFRGVSAGLDTTLVFNHVTMPYGGGVHVDKVQSDRYRSLNLPNTLLTDNDGPWTEVVVDGYLNRQSRPRLKTRVPMKWSPHLKLGQRLRVTSVYHSFEEQEFRVTEVSHDLNSYQSILELREEESEKILFLPAVEDMVYTLGYSLPNDILDPNVFRLPEATGGKGSKSYSLTGDFSIVGFDFVSSTRVIHGTAVEGNVEVVYKVTDSSTPSMTRERKFRIEVKPVLVTDVKEPVRKEWSGVAVAGTTVLLLSDVEDKVYYRLANGNLESKGFGTNVTGKWVDAAGYGSAFYILEASRGEVWRSTSSNVPTKLFDISESGDWVAITANGTYLYILNELDWKVYVLDHSGNRIGTPVGVWILN